MGRRKRGKRKNRGKLTVDGVLSGRQRPGAEDLVRLIAEVNPTGQELPDKSMQQRYEQKTRLQGLLIERFGDSIAVSRDAESHDVVLFTHRHLGLNACHAPIDALDVDARAWVQLQLDMQEADDESGGVSATPPERTPRQSATSESPAPTEDDSELSTQELLSRGQTATDAYDYETAKKCFEAALVRSGGRLVAASALMTLLVEHLGLFGEALEWSEHLASESRRDPALRSLVALAAAELGDSGRALEWIGDLREHAAVMALVRLVDHAVSTARWDDAQSLLSRAKAAGADPSMLLPRERAVSEGRAQARAPREKALEVLWGSGDVAATETEARALLEQWPQSRVARRVLREIQDQRRDAQRDRLVQDADRTMDNGDPAAALRLLSEAAELGRSDATSSQIREKLQSISKVIEADRSKQRIVSAVSALRKERSHASLTAFLGLAPEERTSVLTKIPDDDGLARLHTLSAQAKGGTPDSLVGALLGLERAQELMEAGELEGALASLDTDRTASKRFPETKQLRSAILARLAERQRAMTSRAMDQLEQALKTTDVSAIEGAASELKGCSPTARAVKHRIEELLARAADVARRVRLAKELEARESAGELFEARRLAMELMARCPDDEEARWSNRGKAIQERIQREWRVHELLRPADVRPGTEPESHHYDESVEFDRIAGALMASLCHAIGSSEQQWLRPEAGSLDFITAQVFGRWIFIAERSHRAQQTTRIVVMRAPITMSTLSDIVVDAGRIWISDWDGKLVQLSLDQWHVLRCCEPTELVLGDRRIEQTIIQPNTDYFWISHGNQVANEEVAIVDLKAWRVVRKLNVSAFWHAIPGEVPETACEEEAHQRWSVFDARGRRLEPLRTDDRRTIIAAYPLRDDAGHLLITIPPGTHPGDEDAVLQLVLMAMDGTTSRSVRLAGSDAELVHGCAVQRCSPHVVCYWHDTERQKRLQAFEIADGQVHPLWEIATDGDVRLLQDHQAQRLLIQAVRHDSTYVFQPTGCVPDLPGRPMQRVVIPAFDSLTICSWPQYVSEEMDSAARALQSLSARNFRASLDALLQNMRDDPDQLFFLLRQLRHKHQDDYDRLLFEVTEWHPRDGALTLLLANHLAAKGRWEELRERLVHCRSAELTPEAKQHKEHLLGLSYYMLNQPDTARKIWLDAKEHGEHCKLDGWIELTAPPPQPKKDQSVDENQPPLSQLSSLIRAADEALSRGDPLRATELLDRHLVWQAQELQSLARFARAWLSIEVSHAVQTARKTMALAAFVSMAAADDPLSERGLPLADRTWGKELLVPLAKEAETWLDGVFVE